MVPPKKPGPRKISAETLQSPAFFRGTWSVFALKCDKSEAWTNEKMIVLCLGKPKEKHFGLLKTYNRQQKQKFIELFAAIIWRREKNRSSCRKKYEDLLSLLQQGAGKRYPFRGYFRIHCRSKPDCRVPAPLHHCGKAFEDHLFLLDGQSFPLHSVRGGKRLHRVHRKIQKADTDVDLPSSRILSWR